MDNNTENKSNDKFLGEIIKELLNEYKLNGKLRETRLIESWEKILGKMIAKHTSDIKLKKNVLHISLDSAALRQELSMNKTKIIEILNKELGENIIEKIVLK